MFKDLEEVRDYFKKDRFATDATGCVIEEAKKHYAKCSMAITTNHLNANDTVMGGAIYTLADFSFAVAANMGEAKAVSSSCSISFLGVAKGTMLYATTECIKEGRSTCCYQTRVEDELGNLVACVLSNGFILTKSS